MIWLVVTLMVLVVILMVGLLQSVRFCIRDHQTDHAKCIAHIASVTSNRVVAQAVHNLAEKWDSIEEQSNLRVLANTKYSIGGPSMPVIWLHEQARRIEEEGK